MFGTFRLFRIFDIDVVANWTIFLLIYFGYQGGGWPGALALLLAVLLHELGHALTAKKFGAYVEGITLGFVGMASFSGHLTSWQRALIAFMGPGANFLTAIGIYFFAAGAWQGDDAILNFSGGFLTILFSASVSLGILNLIPALPLDGGYLLQHVLENFTSEHKAKMFSLKLTMFISLLMVFAGLAYNWFSMVIFGGLFFFMAYSSHKVLSAFTSGSSIFGDFVNSLKQKSSERQQKKKQEDDLSVRSRVDQLLVKISKEGMNSLSEEEREFLTEASKRLNK